MSTEGPNHLEHFDPSARSERADVLRFVGKRFYDQCDYLLQLIDTRRLIPLEPDDVYHFVSQQLIDFQNTPGIAIDYKNSKNEDVCISKRDGKDGLIEFEISSDPAFDTSDVNEEWADTYLLQSNGTIVAAEHCIFAQDNSSEHIITPIEVNAEELMYKITNEFQPNKHAEEIQGE